VSKCDILRENNRVKPFVPDKLNLLKQVYCNVSSGNPWLNIVL